MMLHYINVAVCDIALSNVALFDVAPFDVSENFGKSEENNIHDWV